MFKIEKDIPAPTIMRGPGAKGKSMYPIHEMAVGDSFFIPTTNHGVQRLCGRIKEKKFAFKNENGGTRVWRTA